MPEEVRRAADLLERRFALTILYAAGAGAQRFNEFRQACGPIPPATLAARLADLEAAGIVRRDVIDSRPPRAEYRLTAKGERLRRVVAALAVAAGR